MIRRAYDAGRALPAEVVEMMAQVCESSGCSEELLAPWYNMREALSWREDYYYPLVALESVERAVEREWSLLDRALALSPPKGWMGLVRCNDCLYAGQARTKGPSPIAALWATLRRRHVRSVVECARCGSKRLASLSDPDARGAYLDQMAAKR
jgi:hypothetical protein